MLADEPEEEPEDEPQDEPTPTVEPAQQHFSPMDITADGSANPDRQWSPMNLATDGGYESDSLGADDLPIADLRAPPSAHTQTQDNKTAREYGRATYDTPIIDATEHHFLDNDENIHSTPSKMPSPTRERMGSSARSSRLAGNTVSPRDYPTPTPTSSLADEENHPEEQTVEVSEDLQRTSTDHENQTEPLPDPTDEHEEFDSIMESEGFTMVSLDSLPSAKQYGLGSSAKMNTDSPGKEREIGRIRDRLKRKLPGTIDNFRSDTQSSTRPSPVTEARSPRPRALARTSLERHTAKAQAPAQVSYPELPMTRLTEKPLDNTPRRTPISLARVVRVGMALQGTFKPHENEVPGSGNASRKKRLEGVFSSFSPATQRELRAALGIGQELAMRQALAAEEQVRAQAEEIEDEPVPVDDYDYPMGETQGDDDQSEVEQEEKGEEEEDEPMPVSVQSRQTNSPQVNTHDSIRTQRELEWQREREIVSRHARDPKNSKRLIYIESDEDIPQEDPKYAFDGRLQTGVESAVDEQPLDEEPFDEEVPDDESFDEELENFEPDVVPVSQPVTTQAIHVEQEPIYEDDDDGSEDIWRQDTSNSEPEHVLEPLPVHDQNMDMEQEALDDDDGDDDIWQLEARDQSHLSQQSESRAQRDVVQDPSSPWRKVASLSANQDQLSSSPAYVTLEHPDGLHQVPTHIRKLRDQDVDLSAILAEEETPNRARYYNGTSTPREMPNRRPGIPLPSAMKSASSTRKTGQRVRLQPISQSSPEIGSEAELSYSPAFKPNNSHQESTDEEADEPFSDAAHETDPGYADAATATPKPPRQSDQDAPASTWLQRITSLTPRWLKAPNGDEDDSSSSASAAEDEYEDDDKENQVEIANIELAQDVHGNYEPAQLSDRSSESPSRYLEESASGYVPSIEEQDRHPSAQGDFDGGQDDVSDVDAEADIAEETSSVEEDLVEADAVEMINTNHAKSVRPRPLPTFGYFSDEHYKALRRVYRMAKRSPERFPYHEAPGRAEIIGDWIWTSDGHHGVPITEVQFAIIDRFVFDLSRADVEYGGSGEVEWTEADLHRRLISIIIGEQIRENQKAKSARGASVDTWR
jgi:hypothetical protein